MKVLVKKIISFVKSVDVLKIAQIAVLVLSIATTAIVVNLNGKLKHLLEQSLNNAEAYKGIIANRNAENAVLKLSVQDLTLTEDSLIHRLDSVRNRLKISDKAIKLMAASLSRLKVDTIIKIIPNKDNSFEKEIVFNLYTKANAKYANDSLTLGLDIKQEHDLFVHTDRQWKNKGKNFFKRLFTWDWKKITVTKYKLTNHNELIKQGAVRVIEVQQ